MKNQIRSFAACAVLLASVERTGGGTSELSRLRGFNEDGTLAAVAELRVDAGGYAELSLSVLARDRWKTRITKNATKEGLLAFTGEKFDDDFDRRGRELVLVASPDGGTSAGPIGCGIAVAGAVVACGATAPVVAACALAAAAAICACNEGC